MDNDQLLADVLGTGPFILGYSFSFAPEESLGLGKGGLPPFKVSQIRGSNSKPADK
jgi:hypothetical protein